MASVIPLTDLRTVSTVDTREAFVRAAAQHTAPAADAPPVDTRGRLLHDLRISVTDRCNFR